MQQLPFLGPGRATIIIITETYLPIVKDSPAQGEAKEEAAVASPQQEAALTFGQPLRQTYLRTVLNIYSPTPARGRARKLQAAASVPPPIIIPSRHHCWCIVCTVPTYGPFFVSHIVSSSSRPTCSWSLRLIRSLHPSIHLEKQPPHRRFLPPALTAAKSTSTSTQPDPQLQRYCTSLHRPSCCERQT
jgi:hypothetical protein